MFALQVTLSSNCHTLSADHWLRRSSILPLLSGLGWQKFFLCMNSCVLVMWCWCSCGLWCRCGLCSLLFDDVRIIHDCPSLLQLPQLARFLLVLQVLSSCCRCWAPLFLWLDVPGASRSLAILPGKRFRWAAALVRHYSLEVRRWYCWALHLSSVGLSVKMMNFLDQLIAALAFLSRQLARRSALSSIDQDWCRDSEEVFPLAPPVDILKPVGYQSPQ